VLNFKIIDSSGGNSMYSKDHLQSVAERFAIQGKVIGITPINKGYINRTYKVETLSVNNHIHQYILQRVNTNVFPDIDALMTNYRAVTEQLSKSLHMPGKHWRGTVQTLRTTKDGELYFRDDSGCWRMMTFFDDVYSLDIPERPEEFYYAGVSFGWFIKAVSNMDPSQIEEVIPNFHNTPSRYRDLEASVARDPVGRVAEVAEEIAFVRGIGLSEENVEKIFHVNAEKLLASCIK
jgi:hypothetical protein